MQNFGEAIKTFRKSSGLTQTQFADRLGVHLQTISKWERGLLAPDFSLLGEIASVLSVSLETLLGLPQSEETFTGSFDMASFGRALAEARKKKNESQSELAEALGVSTDNISKWERGVICPDVYELVSIATHFDLPASKLYFGICEETEVESPAQWRRRKRLHILWFVCAVLPLCAIVVVLSVLLAVLPRTELAERTEFSINYWLCGGAFRTEVPGTIRAEDGEVTLAVPQKEGANSSAGTALPTTPESRSVLSCARGRISPSMQSGATFPMRSAMNSGEGCSPRTIPRSSRRRSLSR